MYFSGKITNSILIYLARQGFSVESLLEQTEVPAEFLRDPSCWLESHKVESFLNLIEKEFRDKMSDQQ
ncbi:MAG: hypothetical protein KDD29_08945, partial [Flavobacteriales bacterium]|nr:hypothetical protein [Flavobacteriales bacterium]